MLIFKPNVGKTAFMKAKMIKDRATISKFSPLNYESLEEYTYGFIS